MPTFMVVDVGGISFILAIPISTFDRLPSVGDEVEVLTYMNVRDDAIELYGFYTAEERDLFKMLIGISKIGPKSAVGILSGTTPDDFKRRIIAGDVGALTALPGIGPKTAKRIIVELKEKFVVESEDRFVSGIGEFEPSEFEEALIALTSLGYSRGEVFKVLSEMKRKDEFKGDMEQIIKIALSKF